MSYAPLYMAPHESYRLCPKFLHSSYSHGIHFCSLYAIFALYFISAVCRNGWL